MKQRLPLSDADPEVERILIEEARKTPDWKKFEQIAALTEAYRNSLITEIKQRHPNASDAEVRSRLAVILLGKELAKEVYGWDQEIEED